MRQMGPRILEMISMVLVLIDYAWLKDFTTLSMVGCSRWPIASRVGLCETSED
jgi:hypothetical protein